MERTRTARERRPDGGPSSLDEIFAGGNDAPVNVRSGLIDEDLPLAGESIERIRRTLGDRLDIDPESHAFIDGQPVSEDAIVQAGQRVYFMRQAGEKGAA